MYVNGKMQNGYSFLKKAGIRRKGLTSLGIYGKILLKAEAFDAENNVPNMEEQDESG